MQMKIKIIIKRLVVATMVFGNLSSFAHAVWQGKLDLQSSVQPLVLREVHDGQWLAGIAHPSIFRLDHNNNTIIHAGVFQAWNAENGNASFGPLVGLDLSGISNDLGFNISDMISSLGKGLNLPTFFKPAAYFADILSLDAFVGYRPIHTADVNGELVYGGAACLKIPFGVSELQNGL